MRVALVTNGLLYGGAERIVEAIALDLHARGDQVRVIATTRDGPIGDALRGTGITVDVLKIRSAYDARVAVELGKILRAHRAELVHSHLTVSDLASLLAHPLARDAKLVSTVHSVYVGLNPWLRRAWHAGLFAFDEVIAVSEVVRASLPRRLKTTLVKPSLIDPEARADRSAARARLDIAEDVPLVLAVGRLAHVKGFDVLMNAAAALTTPNAKVIVIGDGEARAGLREHRSFTLIGARDDAGALLAAADVVACPSRSEGFPQVPLHAMAAGVPVVATRVGGTPEVVEDGVTGLLVPSEDPAALASAIDRLLADRALAEMLGKNGRERLQAQGLTKAAMLERTRAVYRRLLD